jgi:hypothetical protein
MQEGVDAGGSWNRSELVQEKANSVGCWGRI